MPIAAARRCWRQRRSTTAPIPSGFWQPERTEQSGVTAYDPARAVNGYTLYTSGEGQRAVLVSMTGEILHEWQLPFSAIWDDTASVKDPRPDSMIHYREAYLYPNGDLLAIYEAVGDTPWGYGLAKMDKDSRLIWKYLAGAHHDLGVATRRQHLRPYSRDSATPSSTSGGI